MRAVVYAGPRRVEVRDVAPPGPPKDGEALVRVSTSGICGTDLHLISGDVPDVDVGSVLGHEFVGEVIAVGEGVRRHAIGDVVMASDFTACGHCRQCRRADHWHCPQRAFFGSGRAFGPATAGGQAEQVLVPNADTTLERLPPGCSAEAGVLIGDNLATAWAALARSRLVAGERVVVIGGGAVGQLTSLCALALGAGRVIVVEPNERRRSLVAAQGGIPITPEEAAGLVSDLTDGDGADVVVDAVGGSHILDSAAALVRPGGRVASVGVPGAEQWSMPVARSFRRELSLSFVIGNSIPIRLQLIDMILGGALDPTIVVDSRVSLDAAPDAYQRLLAQQHLKTIIEL
jgi:2-desacetyl-2-hydroxyethyl bacteriochlorophyllide A dehydrogenase